MKETIKSEIIGAIRRKLSELSEDVKTGPVCTQQNWEKTMLADLKLNYPKHTDLVNDAYFEVLETLPGLGISVKRDERMIGQRFCKD